MPTFLVIAGPYAANAPETTQPLRWLQVPASGRLEVREAASGLEAIEADLDLAVSARQSAVLLPPLPHAGDRPEIRFRLTLSEGGFELAVPKGKGDAAQVLDLDRTVAYTDEPRAVEKGRIIRVRSTPGACYDMLLLDAKEKGDEDALATALSAGAHAFDAANDWSLSIDLTVTTAKADWTAIDAALRARRDMRAPFLAALAEGNRARVLRAWMVIVCRILWRHGFPVTAPLGDEGRDFFLHVRAGIERLRGFPTLARDTFALGVARALDALAEPPGKVRLVPLARREGKDMFELTLSRAGEYRIFDVLRNDAGEAIVSGRRVVKATAEQRVRAVLCPCGGKTYENDRHCRGCGTPVGELGSIRVEGTFIVGATAEVAALCSCDGPIGAEDRFCGSCGRSLEESP
jgi:hypothetical protein